MRRLTTETKEEKSIKQAFHKLSRQLFEPHRNIQEPRKRQRARLFSIIALAGIPIFLHLHIVYSAISSGNPIFLIGVISALVMYFLSRTRYVDIAIIFSVSAFSIIPTLFYFLILDWSPNDPPELVVWITVSLLLSSFFIKPKYVILQYLITVSIILILGLGIFSIDPYHIGEEVSVTLIIMVLIVMSSSLLEHYVAQVIDQNEELDKRRWELEVYTQLLRHDLRNDMQSIVAAVGLSLMAFDENPSIAKESLDTSLSVAKNVVKLLEAFSVPPDASSIEIITMIENIAKAAQETHRSLKIAVNATHDARKSSARSSRLMPLVWSNIFRNAALHAGPNPIVRVDISLKEDMLQILVSDNGPGISPSEKDWLFVRGKGDESKEGGIGLYLARIIIESHGGRITVLDSENKIGCNLLIRIPVRLSIS
jgi:signal transduction histidine kinase